MTKAWTARQWNWVDYLAIPRALGGKGEYLESYRDLRTARYFKTIWFVLLSEHWVVREVATEKRPARWARVALKNNLRVVINPAQARILTEKGISAAIKKVNEVSKTESALFKQQWEALHDMSCSDKIDAKWQQIYDKEAKKAKGRLEGNCTVEKVNRIDIEDPKWFQLPTSPFDLYESYIHVDDWHEYMKSLAIDVQGEPKHVVRQGKLSTPESISQSIVTLPDRSGSQPQPSSQIFAAPSIQKATKGSRGKKRSAVSKASQASSTERHSKSVNDAFETALRQKEQIFGSTGPDKPLWKHPKGVRLYSSINYAKIDAAARKRSGVKGQNAVMGGTSAAEVASELLGWKHKASVESGEEASRDKFRLQTGFNIAEWLHLRAFSWGSHALTDDYKPETNQSPLNIVLGTSEANSVMCRYEKAWQNLFIIEHNLRDQLKKGGCILTDDGPSGHLWICTNPPVDDVDEMKNGGDWDIWSAGVWGGDISKIEVDKYEGHRFLKPQLEDANSNDREKVMKEYPWVAYVIYYHLSMSSYSYVLQKDKPTKAVRFYPFRRAFYHRAESLLDSQLMELLREQARVRIRLQLEDKKKDPDTGEVSTQKPGGQGPRDGSGKGGGSGKSGGSGSGKGGTDQSGSSAQSDLLGKRLLQGERKMSQSGNKMSEDSDTHEVRHKQMRSTRDKGTSRLFFARSSAFLLDRAEEE
ncbi:hypothetical protein BGZ63DRAFT_425164 [Mariannaea sp. PMI_226]|nr:hypothetical protein BGZ63DRAFT_425164 [Mariannaea sp. PMI_226]